MRTKRQTRRTRLGLALGASLLALVSGSATHALAAPGSARHGQDHPRPTVVLVHGAWADSSSWADVVAALQHDGYPVVVVANPLRGLASDSAYLRAYLASIPGPIVLVGHSYGGAVITNAAAGNSEVKALVYVDAFAPDLGESVVELAAAQPGSALAVADPTTVFSIVPIPGGQGDVDLTVLPTVFITAFANDLRPSEAAVLAATQRPVAASALSEASGVPAWRTIPSWYLAGRIDGVLPFAEQVIMANRAGAHLVKVRAGHLPMVSRPDAVESIIDAAADATD